MASLDILCFNPFSLKNKIMKIEHQKIFRGPSRILKNISRPINICLKYFMAPTKTLRPPSYILNVQSLNNLMTFLFLEIAISWYLKNKIDELFTKATAEKFSFKKVILKSKQNPWSMLLEETVLNKTLLKMNSFRTILLTF